MASVLQHSGIAEGVYDMFYKWMGGLKGGLSMGTVLICTIFAAITGVSGAATISMGLIAIPSMLKRNYNKHLAVGCVAVGGVLGIVIPPSCIMIIYGVVGHESVAALFMGGVIPGIICAAIYNTYIGMRCWQDPKLGPAVPVEERATWGEKLASLRAVVLPLVLIVTVLGSIYTGIATPTEAAAVGALGSFVCAAIHRRLTLPVFKNAIFQVLRLTSMVMWIVAGATCFSNLYTVMGARDLITSLVMSFGMNPWLILILMQLSLFILGCMMDDYAIVMICAPIYVPIVKALGFDTLWFAILFILNMQIAYLTPPYGFNLFYLRGIVPKDITMGDLYRAVAPFIPLQILGLALVIVFPQLATWLPSKIG